MKSFLRLTLGLALIGTPVFARDIAVADLPKPVAAAIQKAHPGMKLIKAEEDSKPELHYEVKIELKDQSRLELELKPDGTLLTSKTTD